MLLQLHMMVRNEAARLRGTLESVKPWIDSWTILDTGSTDGTQGIVHDVLGALPGRLFEEQVITYADTGIIDFAATRNRGLELAQIFDATFLLLLNGDDILLDGEALRSFCRTRQNESDGGCFLRIVGCPRGEYVSTRLMRTAKGWRYSLPTHEILHGTDPVKVRIPVRIQHHEASLEDRQRRWQQDLIVLQHYCKSHADEPRPLFYLAQTHECLGNYAQAGQLYSRAAAMTGWSEEAYEARRRVAQCTEHLVPPGRVERAAVQQLYLDAYATRPTRAEALFAIAEYWHKQDNHTLTCLFATEAASLSVPELDSLMVDREVYEWRAANLVAIHAYYLGRMQTGRNAALRVTQARPDDMTVRRNLHFYIEPLPVTRRVPLQLNLEPGWHICNPSIHSHDGALRAVVRAVNYIIRPNGSYEYDGVIHTRNYFVALDPSTLGVEGSREMLDLTGLPRTKFPVHGFEDCRLFWWRGSYHAICTVRDTTDEGTCEQALLHLDSFGNVQELSLLRGAWSHEHQKNWKPAVDGDRLRWIYTTDPLTVFEHGQSPSELPPFTNRLLGSSQAIQLPDGTPSRPGGWLWVDHEVSWNDKKKERIYAHRFVLADHGLQCVVAKSDPFYFENRGVEFCAGLASHDGDAILSYSVRDATATLAVLPWTTVLNLLKGV